MPRGEHLAPAPIGNGLAVKHGCYSTLRLAPRAREIREALEELLPLRSAVDSAAVDLAALALSQAERAGVILSAVQADEAEAIRDRKKVDPNTAATLQRLSQDARGWTSRAQSLLADLGCSPRSRLQLGLDLVRAESAVEALIEQGRQARERAESR